MDCTKTPKGSSVTCVSNTFILYTHVENNVQRSLDKIHVVHTYT